jgi:23S rRNA pseudouridine2604 synthase
MSKTLSLSRKPAPAAARSPPAAPARRAGGPRPPVPARQAGGAEARAPTPAAPRPQAEPAGTVRLNKRMAELGLCSRREADAWIERGWVRVNGEVASMGMQVTPDVHITVDQEAQGQQRQQVTILLNKPIGFVSGQAEDGHQPAVTLVNPRTHWRDDRSGQRFSPPQLRGLAPCGRLDIDSTGLLVLTQDGRVARQLIGEDSQMEKEYLVRVVYQAAPGARLPAPGERAEPLQEIDERDPVSTNVQAVFPLAMLARLRHGLSLDGQPLKPARVDWQNPEQLRFVLTEGKKRQIRRMCELVGLKVVGLKRIRIGRVVLGNLPVGQWRYLAPHERF